MKKYLRCVASLVFATLPILTFGQEKVGKVRWEYAYVDLGEKCDRYYSLHPPEVTCIEDRLYAVRFKISYKFREEDRVVFLDYIPNRNTPLDENGNLKPRDLEIKGRY